MGFQKDLQKTLPLTESVQSKMRARERAPRKPFLVVLHGDDVGARFRIEGSCIAGRDSGCDITLNDTRVSTRHASFEMRDDGVWVVDLDSTNGTTVNDVRIEREARLQSGDRVFLGSTVLRFDWLDALEQSFHEELERLINIDALTGLLQKRRFDIDGSALVEATLRERRSVAVLMMDLDGIKRINDSHGHVCGAHCIAEAGALIGRIVADRGIATRWGGDEYSAILPGLGFDAGKRIAEEILASMRTHAFVCDGVRLHPGVSIGLAVGPDQGIDLETLQRRADEALYRAKRAGKGRVSV